MKLPLRLIIEGHDGAGKTSLSKALSAKLDVPLYKCSKERTRMHLANNGANAKLNILRFGIREQLDLIQQCNISVIYDRFFPSEWVYSHILERQTSDELVFEYDEWWSELSGKIIFLYKDFVEEQDELIQSSLLDSIKNRYVEYSKLKQCKFLFLNTTDKNVDNQLTKIISFLNES